MSKQRYDWKRFWCPRGAQISLGDRGYLVDPESEWGKHYNPELVGLEAIADIPCLVLLGEPGIGKSQEMKNLSSYTEKFIDEEDQILSLNLEDCSEDKLYTGLFESNVFTDWINGSGTHRLYLFLDSLDQGWLKIPKLPTLLVEEFSKLDSFPKKEDPKSKSTLLYLCIALQTGFLQTVPKIKNRPTLSRLYLRVACRTAIFSPAENSFKELWSNDLRTYDLTPLCPLDIKVSLDTHNLDADTYLKEIEHKGLMPLAIKPITLEFLIKKLRRSNKQLLPNQRLADLYLDGCRELCREPKDATCHPSRPVSSLEVEQRLIIAARIAAITTFCMRSTVWIGQNLGDDDPNKDVLIRELCGQSEYTNSEKGQQITPSVIKEVLDTALFSYSSHESSRIGWAHQTYAEFLAAWYLKQHSLNRSQILSLVFHPDQRVIPQLQETTAWLASMIPEVFQEVMKTDPDVLLQSDISTVDDENKAKLVESLLKLHNKEKLEYFHRWRYSNLKYPGLEVQLESYIRDSTKNQWSRLIAIDIAQDCDVKAVQNSLANIALDEAQLYVIRTHAAHTICAIGDEETKARLVPLALSEVRDNPNDALKGYGLRAVWSQQHITVEDLLNHLSQSLQRGTMPIIGGVYQDFIARELVQHLQLCDLPVMLKWTEQLPKRYNLHYPFRELAD